MANWFQDHPTTSIVSYTLLIAGATWAASTFILQDNRLNLAKAEVESQKTLAEQYKSKAELLQKDLDLLRTENQEYRSWLANTKDAVPIMVPRLLELRRQVEALSAQAKTLSQSAAGSATASTSDGSSAVSPTASGSKSSISLPASFSEPRTTKLGIAYIDQITGLIVAVKKTSPDKTAVLRITYPGNDQAVEESIHAGSHFKFRWGTRAFQLTVLEINFVLDTVVFQLKGLDA